MIRVWFAPGYAPFDPDPVWVEITDRVTQIEWAFGRQRDLEDFPPGEASVALKSDDRLFDPENTSGAYYGQLLPRVPFKFTESVDLFYGFVEDGWDQTYQPPSVGRCTVKLVDLLAVLDGYILPAVHQRALIDSGALTVYDIADDGQWVDLASGLDASPDDATEVEQVLVGGVTHRLSRFTVPPSPTPTVSGTRVPTEVSASIPDLCPSALPMTLQFVASLDTYRTSVLPWLNITLSKAGNAGTGVEFTWSRTDFGFAIFEQVFARSNIGTNRMRLAVEGMLPPDGSDRPLSGLHHFAVVYGTTSVLIYIDGVATSVSTAGVSLIEATNRGLRVANNDTRFESQESSGAVGLLAIHHTALTAGQITDLSAAALRPLAGQRSDEQVAWILDTIGVPAGMYDLEEGRSIMGSLASQGRDALELIREIVRTEQGAFFVNHHNGGRLTMRSRYASWDDVRSVSPQAVFSDDSSDTTAVRVEPGSLIVEANGVRSIHNQATVEWVGGSVTHSDTASRDAYGPRGVTVQTAAASANQALGIAQWRVLLGKDPRTRIRGLGIDSGAAPDGRPAAVALRVGDQVTYRSQPNETGSVLEKQLEVLGGSHRIDDGLGWETQFYTTDSPSESLTLFRIEESLLDGPDVLAY